MTPHRDAFRNSKTGVEDREINEKGVTGHQIGMPLKIAKQW